MTSESNAFNLAQSAFEAVCKERDEVREQLKRTFDELYEEQQKHGITKAHLTECQMQLQAMRKEHNEVGANYVAMCSRLQECVQEHGIGLGGEKLDKLVCDEIKLLTKDLEEERHAWQKERENAMADYVAVATQLQAMREAIKEAWIEINYAESGFAGLALRVCPNDSAVDLILSRMTAALTKLQPFIAP